MEPFKIFIGWDSSQVEAYEVCKHSLLRHSSIPLNIIPLKQNYLRELGLYNREKDPLASTEFTYTRFLVPHLANYNGWVLFCDSDFLFTTDIAELLKLKDPTKAVMCVHHKYEPSDNVKMEGKPQTNYPRKNWSSLVLWNLDHPNNKKISPNLVNSDVINGKKAGAYLHQFMWLNDDYIGELPKTWNWLEGWDKMTETPPNAIHYTRGGPWFDTLQDVDYAELWVNERELLKLKV